MELKVALESLGEVLSLPSAEVEGLPLLPVDARVLLLDVGVERELLVVRGDGDEVARRSHVLPVDVLVLARADDAAVGQHQLAGVVDAARTAAALATRSRVQTSDGHQRLDLLATAGDRRRRGGLGGRVCGRGKDQGKGGGEHM